MLADECFFGLQGTISGVPHGARDADCAVIAQITANLTNNHGHSVGRKAHIEITIKIVDGFDQTDAADLKQIVHRLAASVEALDDREHQTEISTDEFFPRCGIAVVRLSQQIGHLVCWDDGQGRGIDTADFHFALHDKSLLACLLTGSLPNSTGGIYGLYFFQHDRIFADSTVELC